MKKLSIFIFTMLFLLLTSTSSFALEDPLSKSNNFVGIHVLFQSELEQAATLVNSSGGEWGYVTIPIQTVDRDMEKWQAFMDQAKKLKVIPLVRIATQPDPANTAVWSKPTDYDLIDFANFLSALSWPTKNKYVILFNEVNRSDEWGGTPPSPTEYAQIVISAHDIFKSRDQDFYLILGGMDAAAPNDYVKYISGLTYLSQLLENPKVVQSIDGFSSHSYPNPAFSAPPSETKPVSVATYRFEYDMINNNAPKKLPAFITETGWSDKTLSASTISQYYEITFNDIWNKDKDKIVAITPFLLTAGHPFDVFSFFKDGKEKEYYKTLFSLSKEKGKPSITANTATIASSDETVLGAKSFEQGEQTTNLVSPFAKLYIKTILGLN